MRLPWWPIYVDAHVDKNGVSYETPDGVSHRAELYQLLPLKWSQKIKSYSILDEQLRKLKYKHGQIIIHADKDTSEVVMLLTTGISYTYSIRPKSVLTQNVKCVLLMLSLALLPASILLMFLLAGTPSVPMNDVGYRFQNGFLVFIGLMSTIVLGVLLLIVWQLKSISSLACLAGVTKEGIVAQTSSGEREVVPYAEMDHPKSSWGLHAISTTNHGRILIPHVHTAHLKIIKRNVKSKKQPSMKTVFWIALFITILGPSLYFWNTYLIPDDPYTLDRTRYLIPMVLGPVFILNAYIVRWMNSRQAKNFESKSQ